MVYYCRRIIMERTRPRNEHAIMKLRECLTIAIGLIVFATAITTSAPSAIAQTIRVACVGDSITRGASIPDPAVNTYPAQLNSLLGNDYEVRNFGVSGATAQKQGDVAYWNLEEFKAVAKFQPAIIIIALGTNDSKPRNWQDADTFSADLTALIKHFRSFPNTPRVFVCTPVPVYKDAFTISQETVRDEVVPAIHDLAAKTDTPLIDLHRALSNRSGDFPDGVHPNAAGAKQIAATVASAIKNQKPANHPHPKLPPPKSPQRTLGLPWR